MRQLIIYLRTSLTHAEMGDDAVVLLATIVAVIIGSFRPEPNLTLTNLNNVSELREQFNQDYGVRVLLLLSPT